MWLNGWLLQAESTGNADERNVVLAKFGHVLSFCLLKLHEEKDKARDEMLKGYGIYSFFYIVKWFFKATIIKLSFF